MSVKLLLTAILLLSCALTSCDRGSHPRGIGTMAPDFTVKDNDRTVALHELRGKTVVLNFWATWCAPCIEEMPSLVQMQKRVGDRAVVLAVSIDTDEDAYHKFLKVHNVDLLTVRDPDQKASTLYGTSLWPETYIIDANGTIRRKFIGAVNWTSPDIIEYVSKL
ncbi:MAG: TlpA family protein disulfide reductase [Acidobacteriia bacterium]|nr:TlpA family protein disulfide reductase [Terriglobia bacterium]